MAALFCSTLDRPTIESSPWRNPVVRPPYFLVLHPPAVLCHSRLFTALSSDPTGASLSWSWAELLSHIGGILTCLRPAGRFCKQHSWRRPILEIFFSLWAARWGGSLAPVPPVCSLFPLAEDIEIPEPFFGSLFCLLRGNNCKRPHCLAFRPFFSPRSPVGVGEGFSMIGPFVFLLLDPGVNAPHWCTYFFLSVRWSPATSPLLRPFSAYFLHKRDLCVRPAAPSTFHEILCRFFPFLISCGAFFCSRSFESARPCLPNPRWSSTFVLCESLWLSNGSFFRDPPPCSPSPPEWLTPLFPHLLLVLSL